MLVRNDIWKEFKEGSCSIENLEQFICGFVDIGVRYPECSQDAYDWIDSSLLSDDGVIFDVPFRVFDVMYQAALSNCRRDGILPVGLPSGLDFQFV